MIPDELAGLGVLAVALRLGEDRADHLRVAVVAAFGQVDVPARQLERGVGTHRSDRGHVALDEEGRDDLEERGDGDRDRDVDREPEGQALPTPVPGRLLPDVDPVGEADDRRAPEARVGRRRIDEAPLERRRPEDRDIVAGGRARQVPMRFTRARTAPAR